MPSLAKPQRADLHPPQLAPHPGQASDLALKSPANDLGSTPQTTPPEKGLQEDGQAQAPAAPRRVRALPVPGQEDEPAPTIAHASGPQDNPMPRLPEARLDDAKTVYVVSDIVDALRADAGYEPLPRDPARQAPAKSQSLWSRVASWFKRWV